MISKILLHKVATYKDPVEICPSKINYLYGGNGTGKTTLSNIISDASAFENCQLAWKDGNIETLVYNKQFIERNFGQSKTIKGIFTLGKNSITAYEAINTTKEKIEFLKKQIDGLNKNLEKIDNQIASEEYEYLEIFWAFKVKHENFFKPAYTGFVGSKKNFLNKCIVEKRNNKSNILSVEEILQKCKNIFNQSIKEEETIPDFRYLELTSFENSPIFSTIIIGKNNIEIAPLIMKLNNSDWVKDGVGFLNKSQSNCPFCQQDINFNLKSLIEDFFDENYEQQCKDLESKKSQYGDYIQSKIQELRNIFSKKTEIIDYDLLAVEIQLIEEVLKNNLNKIQSKINSPSIIVELDSLEYLFAQIEIIIKSFNEKIESNNSTFTNLRSEQQKLKEEIWRFTTDELKTSIENYLDSADKLTNTRTIILSKINEYELQLPLLSAQIRGWESEITNVTHTINEINKILKLFSFTNFSLAEADETGFYKIIREDGSEGHDTLSEGEYRFITFLYFFQLIKGSTSNSGVTKDKVVVFDDPISSLDSNVLFVVSNLVKETIKSCKENRDGIRQIFILTHNIYFYKEVTFRGTRYKSKWEEESFWVIKKIENQSKISIHTENPIKTSYELLWRELADLDNVNRVTIFNTLRRILEYYFNIIGGLDYESCINSFDGEEKIICKSLVSWINDGSHFVNDDLIFHTDDEEIQKYLFVFKIIFEKMGQKSHYDMMIKAYYPRN